MWQREPEGHGDGMSRILMNQAFLCEAADKTATEACALARRGLAAAVDTDLKQKIQRHIDRLCSGS